ncbi:outer membrane porin, OprD family [Pseudomonas mediterranea]|uniref:Outer membrane porin, OprD family n=1 Tax=Pseudomonas mediterranea TaxID=183795 RepID=A0AAX2DD53_9PSED|nr:OprD family porin [Pseudomonas mediterranea]KGU83133.1 porin [Pseudomonas mediterranea CFBP 5447]MBL0841728.1 OprD family porin [Pseudomonas mediterranea]QHA82910.1 outer membrane porin, OprD family [Pseudomonas mediterranea]UZD98732.1 OprD family porin [Pseudomonas mediterranea]SDU56739.1 outer membrane porin, OprD family [Pseudomonas mediterranea]
MPNLVRGACAAAPATRLALLLALGLSLSSTSALAAGFIDDSHGTLTLRNYYMDRDYKDDGAKTAAREWAQGAIMNMESGFTPGALGFGVDARGLLGIKLDSSPDRSGTELLPVSSSDKRAADEYSRLALTGKLRFGQTLIKTGDVSIFLPFAFASPSRLLPQTFRGTTLSSKDIEGLTLNTGYIDRINRRDSTDYQPMSIASPNRRFNGAATSSHMAYAGGDYQVNKDLSLRAYHAEVADLYQQDTLALLHNLPVGGGVLTTDLRSFFSREEGAAKAGKVDNRNVSALVGYRWGGHRVSLGYMHASGDTATPYVSGTELMGLSEMTMSSDFLNARERTWQAIHDYDFAAVGVPGLRTRLRYVRGDHIDLAALGADDRKEREFQMELGYVIQSGPLKNVGLLARKSIYRNDFPGSAAFRDENQTRFLVTYSVPIW